MDFSRLTVGRLLGFILMMQLVGHLQGMDNQCLPFCKQEDFSGVTYAEISALLDGLFQYDYTIPDFGSGCDYFIPLCWNSDVIDCSPAKDAGSKQGGEQKTKKNPSAPTVITTERFNKFVNETMKKPEAVGKLTNYISSFSTSNQTGSPLSKGTVDNLRKLLDGNKNGISTNPVVPSWLTNDVLDVVEAILNDSPTSGVVENFFTDPVITNKNVVRVVDVYNDQTVMRTLNSELKITGIPEVPELGSSLIVEKVKENDKPFVVKMFYKKRGDEKKVPIIVEGVGSEIPVESFEKYVKRFLPSSSDVKIN